MGFWEWMAKTGLRRVPKGRFSAVVKGAAEIYEGWHGLEAIIGNMPNMADANELWGDFGAKDKEEAYGKQALVFACINKITSAFGEPPLEIGITKDDGEWEAVKNHPIISLLKKPNHDMTRSIFDAFRLTNKLTSGQFYVWMFRNALNEVTELWPIPTHMVKRIPLPNINAAKDGESRLVARYDVKLPGMNKPFPISPRDMIWDRFIDPSSLGGCVSPLQAAYRGYRLDEEKDNYIIEMLENYEVPPVIYQAEGEITPKQMKEFRERLRDVMGKSTNSRGASLLLSGNVKPTPIDPPLRDLDWPGLSAMSESQICAAFGVPPLLVHARVAQENSPLSSPNLEAAEQSFYRGTMLSMWTHQAEILSMALLDSDKRYSGLTIKYNLSGIKALMDDLAELTGHIVEAVKVTLLQINEGRVALGYPADPRREGDYVMATNYMEFRPGEEEKLLPLPDDEDDHLEDWEDEDEYVDDGDEEDQDEK